MRTIRHTKTLFYYDGPQVFEARDAIGGHYIGVMVEPEAEEDRYLIKGASPESLRLFRSGALDLRSLLLDTVSDDWFLGTTPGGLGEPFATTLRQESLDSSGFLPEPGFLLHDQVTEDETLKEARERNNLVMEVSVEPPEAVYEHRIRVFVGKLEKGDTHGTWRISSPEGDFSGKVRDGGPSMEGLKLGSIYRFSCLEEIEEVESTGREIRSLYLLEYESV